LPNATAADTYLAVFLFTGLSFNLIALLALTHFFFPKSREYTSRFFASSYYNPKTEKYGVGKYDGYQILFWIVMFTGIRASTMEYVLAPFAKWHGMTKRKAITRFSEQGWLIGYYAVFWPMGLVCTAPSPLEQLQAS
jgi:acyl-CoA-dependent ceramide synthase